MRTMAILCLVLLLGACETNLETTLVVNPANSGELTAQSNAVVVPATTTPYGYHVTKFKAQKSIGSGVAFANLGYTGSNNLIFFQDGGTNEHAVFIGYGNFTYSQQLGIVDDGTINTSSIDQGPTMGDHAYGGGIAAGDINRDGRIDLVLAHLDAPNGADEFRYEIAFNTAYPLIPWTYSPTYFTISGVGNQAQGAGVALGDIDRNGILDMVLMGNDHPPGGPNKFRYKIGFNIATNGTASPWTAYKQIDGVGNEASGADVALGDIDRNGVLDMILLAYDNPAGANTFRYKVGFNLDTNGVAASWTSNYITVPGVSDLGNDVGAALADLDGNGILDLILCEDDSYPLYIQNEIRYKFGFNLGVTGETNDWR